MFQQKLLENTACAVFVIIIVNAALKNLKTLLARPGVCDKSSSKKFQNTACAVFVMRKCPENERAKKIFLNTAGAVFWNQTKKKDPNKKANRISTKQILFETQLARRS
jgi:hypothetical protein